MTLRAPAMPTASAGRAQRRASPAEASVFVILAGGKGERLWPLVRSGSPKVCLRPDGRTSLLAITLARLRPMARPASTQIITTAPQVDAVRRAMPPAFRRCLVVEPQPKNTAACIALAAGRIAAADPDRIMAVLPADHRIQDQAGFQRSLRAAIITARAHRRIVMIGIRPRRVHPGLGHLRAAEELEPQHGCRVRRVSEFIEKPAPELAKQLAADPSVYWNTGIFVGRAGLFVELIERSLPELSRELRPLWTQAEAASQQERLARAYDSLSTVSFDHGVMAHVTDGLLVAGEFDWDDLGSLDAWASLAQSREALISIGGRNVRAVCSNGGLVATIGIDDAVVVQSGDVTLVCRAQDSQSVRELVEELGHDPRRAKYL